MIHKNKSFEINEKDIFLHDKLQRKEAIENLSSLIVSTKEAFTMSINADWGAGKTTFIRLWQAHLEKEYKINSIYFSAWEDDFSKEPLISILGEINNYISKNFKEEPKIVEKFNKVKEYGGKIVKRALPAFIKGATFGILDFDKGYENAVSAITEEATKELISNYSEEKEIAKSFQDSVQNLLSLIDDNQPFVIFIDELDRCRPLYAIELLERVKHIFGIDGLIFILSIDKKQLSESIKSQYGNIDTNSYLKRFIDLEYNLQNPNKDDFCTFLYKEYAIENTIRSKNIQESYGDLDHLEMIKYLVISLHLTLREIEQAFIQINIVFKTMQPRLFSSHFRVFVFFIILKIKDQKLYFDLIRKQNTTDEIIDSVILPNNRNNDLYGFSTIIKSIVYATSISDEELRNLINQQQEILKSITDAQSDKYQKQEWLIELLKHSYGEWSGYKLNSLIETCIKKVEFLERFNFENSEK